MKKLHKKYCTYQEDAKDCVFLKTETSELEEYTCTKYGSENMPYECNVSVNYEKMLLYLRLEMCVYEERRDSGAEARWQSLPRFVMRHIPR